MRDLGDAPPAAPRLVPSTGARGAADPAAPAAVSGAAAAIPGPVHAGPGVRGVLDNAAPPAAAGPSPSATTPAGGEGQLSPAAQADLGFLRARLGNAFRGLHRDPEQGDWFVEIVRGADEKPPKHRWIYGRDPAAALARARGVVGA